MTLTFNKHYKTIDQITNSNQLKHPIKITSTGLIINPQDLKYITKILTSNLIKYTFLKQS